MVLQLTQLPYKNDIIVPGFLRPMFLQNPLLSRTNSKSSRAKIKIPTKGKLPCSLIHRGLYHFSRRLPALCKTRCPRSSPSQLCKMPYIITIGPVSASSARFSTNTLLERKYVYMFIHCSSRTGGEKEHVLCSLSQLSQAGEHQHRAQLLFVPCLIHCSNTSSLKKKKQTLHTPKN